jgi:dynein heavy chain
LRTRIVSEIALLEERKKNNPIQSSGSMAMKKQASNNVFEKLGFPDNMTYGHRSSLRKECSRFLRFAYLVDFLSLEALANIYTGSVKAMIERIRDLDEGVNMDEVMNADYDDSNQAAGAGVRGQEPLFFVSIKLNDEHEIPASEIKQEEIELYDQKKSAVDEFDLLAHLELEPEKAEDEGSDMEDEEAEEVAPDPIYKKTVPNIEKFWLRMEPDQEDYIEVLMKTFSSGLENIKSFERWGKHNDLAPYAEALEEWDDIVGDTWDEPDNVKLDPKTWIQEDPLYTDQKDMVAGIINSSFSKMNTFLGRFQPILEIFWRNKQFDQQILMDERLSNPIESIGNTIRLFSHYQKMFSS